MVTRHTAFIQSMNTCAYVNSRTTSLVAHKHKTRKTRLKRSQLLHSSWFFFFFFFLGGVGYDYVTGHKWAHRSQFFAYNLRLETIRGFRPTRSLATRSDPKVHSRYILSKIFVNEVITNSLNRSHYDLYIYRYIHTLYRYWY